MVIVEEEDSGRGVLEVRRRTNAGLDYEQEYEESSQVDDESEYEDVDESDLPSPLSSSPLLDRLRRSLSHLFRTSSLAQISARLYTLVASSAWVLTTTLIMVGLPILYAYDREQNAVSMEREQQRFDTK